MISNLLILMDSPSLQDPRGGLISRWSLLPVEEELIILQQFLRFPVTKSISLALIKEDFPMVSVNNNLLPNNNNNHSPPTPTSNGVNGKSYQNQKVQPPSSPQSISPLHQLTSALGISTNKHHNQNQLVSGLSSSLPVAAGKKNSFFQINASLPEPMTYLLRSIFAYRNHIV